MELEDPQDLRARFRKFLYLTNERKKMSKTTLRKRIAITAASALVAGVLSAVVTAPIASANHPAAGIANQKLLSGGTINGSLFVGTVSNTTGAATVTTTAAATIANWDGNMKSLGLLSKDTSSGTAQTATVLAGGKLALYAQVSTAAAFTTSGGSFSDTTMSANDGTDSRQFSADLKSTWTRNITAATGIATIWTAPSTAGTYTVALYTGFITSGTTEVQPSTTNGLPDDLTGAITVTVVASSSGGAYSAAYSACNVAPAAAAITAGAGTAGIDNTVVFTNGDSAYINFDLNDAYNANLSAGNLVVTATSGAVVNIGTGASGATAGTSSTDVDYVAGTSATVRVGQGTSGAPVTTTVTITYNGTTVCTKTITIRGALDKITVDQVGVQNTSGAFSDSTAQWSYQNTGLWLQNGSLFRVRGIDSAGNVVRTDSGGTFAAVASTLTTQVPALAVNTTASTNTASSMSSYAYGSWNCGAAAGQSSVKVQWTETATGKVTTSDAFTARCAGSASGGSYTVSMDKAAYNLGDLAKVTVSFVDSNGNPANTVGSVGANTWNLPFLTGVDLASGLGANAASSTAVTAADGKIIYTLTVGTTTGITAGTYTGIVDFSVPAKGTKATPTYKLSTGGDTTTNADVLKSIVALIASINKQIQALQKLILRR
jgi:hypothetical protein